MPNPEHNIELSEEQFMQLQDLMRAIAAIGIPPDPSAIPEDAELLTARQVARMLTWGESTVRQRDREGRIPAPIRFNGTVQWARGELMAWINAGCPHREKWEMLKQKRRT